MAERMTDKEANAKIAEYLSKADEALRKATEIADEYQIEFSWSGPEYGMGGYYTPAWKSSDSGCEWESSDSSGGWQSSSSSC